MKMTREKGVKKEIDALVGVQFTYYVVID